ncbi:MAG: hypothetical protein WAO28_02585 [Candidatus Microsaccharimonas sp.]
MKNLNIKLLLAVSIVSFLILAAGTITIINDPYSHQSLYNLTFFIFGILNSIIAIFSLATIIKDLQVEQKDDREIKRKLNELIRLEKRKKKSRK